MFEFDNFEVKMDWGHDFDTKIDQWQPENNISQVPTSLNFDKNMDDLHNFTSHKEIVTDEQKPTFPQFESEMANNNSFDGTSMFDDSHENEENILYRNLVRSTTEAQTSACMNIKDYDNICNTQFKNSQNEHKSAVILQTDDQELDFTQPPFIIKKLRKARKTAKVLKAPKVPKPEVDVTSVPKIETNNNGRNSLYKRGDVVNKVTVRLIRRFFKREYWTHAQTIRKSSMVRRVHRFGDAIKIMKNKFIASMELRDVQNIDQQFLLELIGNMCDPYLFKKLPTDFKTEYSKEIQSFIIELDGCCKSYSNVALDSLLKDECFRIAFKILMVNGGKSLASSNKRVKDTDIIVENLDNLLASINKIEQWEYSN